MSVKVSRSDVIWSYIAQFFNVGSGFLTLPLVLHMLSTEEIAMNYLMMTIGAMVGMVDFGFSPQFGRNFTYVFSGAQKLEKEGLSSVVKSDVNYHLLRCLIDAAKMVYRYMSVIVLILMLSGGTWYISVITEGFSNIENSFIIWMLYSVSVFFNIYFSYYSSLLVGRGLVKESKKASMASRILYIALAYILLLCGMGLIGLCIANFISPFLSRWMSYRYFYDADLKSRLSCEKSTSVEVRELFRVIWHNSKKLGVTSVGTYAALKFNLFISGLYLTMDDVSSLGLMIQLANIIVMLSTTFNSSLVPQLTAYMVNNNREGLIRYFAWTLNVYYVLFISMSTLLVILGPWILRIIGSNASLPSTLILLLYLLILFLENNHGLFAGFITIGNSVPYAKVAIISGMLVCLGDVFVLQYTNLGLIGLVLVQGVVQLAYNNWYWPRWVCKELKISLPSLLITGFEESYRKMKNQISKYNA